MLKAWWRKLHLTVINLRGVHAKMRKVGARPKRGFWEIDFILISLLAGFSHIKNSWRRKISAAFRICHARRLTSRRLSRWRFWIEIIRRLSAPCETSMLGEVEAKTPHENTHDPRDFCRRTSSPKSSPACRKWVTSHRQITGESGLPDGINASLR